VRKWKIDPEPPLPDQELRGRDVDRARALEGADGVDAPCGEVAERERE